MPGGVNESERVRITVENRDSEFVAVDSTESYTLFFDTAPEIPLGATGEVSGVVTKVIYDQDDRVDMLFLEDVSLIDTPGTDIKSTSGAEKEVVSIGASAEPSPNESPESTTDETTSTGTQSAQPYNSHSNDSLSKIAEDLIGDIEFDLEEENESIISDAKRRARKQQRDPAVDPKLNGR